MLIMSGELFGSSTEPLAVRILVVTQYFWPENFRINDLVAELVRRGHAVTILTGHPNYPDGEVFSDFREDRGRFNNYLGAEILRVPLLARGRGALRLMLNYLSFVLTASTLGLWRLRGRRFDIIFAYEPSPITVGIPAVILRSIKDAPLVFWVLDLWPETLHALGIVRRQWVLSAVGRLVSWVYARCDLILAQSRSFIPQIAKRCSDSAQVVYFPSWAETLFESGGGGLAPEVVTRTDCFNIMFAGNIGDAQDFPAILAAAEILKSDPRIRWLIVGTGRMAGWVSDEIKRRCLQESVVMLGRFTIDRMPSLFRHADALLVSLRKEPIFSMTIPGKLQSYLASGIPVLAMLDGEGANLVQRSHSGLTCAAGDAAALAAAILRLASTSLEERIKMGRNGLAVSAAEFDRSTLISKLELWFRQLEYRRPDTVVANKK
jgi:colanic acid biosynthesis glycosyl transferase WcaI